MKKIINWMIIGAVIVMSVCVCAQAAENGKKSNDLVAGLRGVRPVRRKMSL